MYRLTVKIIWHERICYYLLCGIVAVCRLHAASAEGVDSLWECASIGSVSLLNPTSNIAAPTHNTHLSQNPISEENLCVKENILIWTFINHDIFRIMMLWISCLITYVYTAVVLRYTLQTPCIKATSKANVCTESLFCALDGQLLLKLQNIYIQTEIEIDMDISHELCPFLKLNWL